MPVSIDWTGWDYTPVTDGTAALDDALSPPPRGGEPVPVAQIGGTTPQEEEPPGKEQEELQEVMEEAEEPRPPVDALKEQLWGDELPPTFSLQAREFEWIDERTLRGIISAFKATCRKGGFVWSLGEDEHGFPRVVVSHKTGDRDGLALLGLEIKLEQTPQLEAALLIELSRKDAALRDLLEERAAIRAADGLADDDMTVALLTIGAAIDGPQCTEKHLGR